MELGISKKAAFKAGASKGVGKATASSDILVQEIPTAGGIGVEIRGFDASMIGREDVRRHIHDLWIQYGLVVFREIEGQDLQVDLSRWFGEPIAHPVSEGRAARGEITTVRYRPEDGWLIEVDGEPLGQWLPWHFDLVYLDTINRGGILRPVVLPDHLGQTGFIDQIAAYDRLPDALKKRIEELYVIYQYDLDPANQRFGRKLDVRVVHHSKATQSIQDRAYTFPRVYHPMVFTQAETGRKVLNVSPWFAVDIKGMENDAGRALLQEVVECVSDENYAYFHEWRRDDMVLWDNWRMLHCAAGAPPEQERWMERTTILGDYGLGKAENKSGKSTEKYLHV